MAFPFYGADGTSGTVAATNGSKTVTGTGTNWLSNNAIPSAGGYCIKMPDAKIYGIDTCTGEGALALSENYAGSNVSGGSYYIIPTAASNAALLNQVSTLLNSSNFSQIAGLSPNSGDFPEYLSGAWTTRSPTQVILNLLNSVGEVSIASASTCDIGAATTPKVQITGTTTITGFGIQANAVRLVRFGGALTLTHNATSLILLGGVDRTTASGDTGIYVSDASGHWREWVYSPTGGVASTLKQLLTTDGDIAQNVGGTVVARTAPPNRNVLINAGFAIDQRNAGASTAISDDTYCFDRWYALTQTAAVNASQLTEPEDGYPFAIRLTQNQATAQRMGLAQIVEGVNCKHLRGGSGTLVPRVRCSSSQAIRYAILGWTGTEDAVTSDIVNSWTNATFTAGQFFNSTTLSVLAVGAQTPSANTWTSLAALTATMGSSFKNIIVFAWTEGTAAQNVTLDIDFVQMEAGATATAFERRDYGSELARCQRYFNALNYVGNQMVAIGQVYSTTSIIASLPFPKMRAAPTATLPTAGSSAGNICFLTASGNPVSSPTVVVSNQSDCGIYISGTAASGLVAGNASALQIQTGASAKILLQAEL